MKWANFLHIYQPPDQKRFIMDKVVQESYRAIISILRDNPHARITMSVIGCLLVKLDDMGYHDVVDGLQKLVRKGQIELTAGTMYHPFLPKLPDSEIFRQINLNNDIHHFYFKSAYKPLGFYSPEAGYSYNVAELAHYLGYKWMIVDEISFSGKLAQREYDYSHTPGFYSGGADLRKIVGTVSGKSGEKNVVGKGRDFPGSGKNVPGTGMHSFLERQAVGRKGIHSFLERQAVGRKGIHSFLERNDKRKHFVDYTKLYTIKGLSGFLVHFRERVISDALASGQITDPDQFLKVLKPEMRDDRYLLTGTDGEAYGHHQWQLADMLGKLYHRRALETITISELPNYFPVGGEVLPIPSTWGTSEEEIKQKNYYARWHHIDNSIHDLQWELTNLAIETVRKLGIMNKELGIKNKNKVEIQPGKRNVLSKRKVGESRESRTANGILARQQLDIALYSCHYWWASARPWWSIELIERGARMLADVVAKAEGYQGGIREVEKRRLLTGQSAKALVLYQDIVFTAFDWLRSEKVADLSHKHK